MSKNDFFQDHINNKNVKEDEWTRRVKCPYAVGEAIEKLKYQ